MKKQGECLLYYMYIYYMYIYYIYNVYLSECLGYNGLVDKLDTNETKHYYRTCQKNVKERYNNYTASFRYESKEKTLNS